MPRSFFTKKNYSLRKSQSILWEALSRLKKQRSRLSQEQASTLIAQLRLLKEAIYTKDGQAAHDRAQEVECFLVGTLRKSARMYLKELMTALFFALAFAALIRQEWFELYEIPTGSMRPTFKEKDHVLVSKTAFGLNIPFKNAHLWFDSHLVKRHATVVISGEGLDLPDTDTVYFGLFPGKKLYLKRCIGKPGDSLYFYGGQVYGVDKEGNAVTDTEENAAPYFKEHIPFLHYEGKIEVIQPSIQDSRAKIVFKHMNIPLARILFDPSNGSCTGQIAQKENWITEAPLNAKQTDFPSRLGDFWGIGNIAFARMLRAEDLPHEALLPGQLAEPGQIYLEIKHTPHLAQRNLQTTLLQKRLNYGINTLLTWIPLSARHLDALKKALYTCRFVVQQEKAWRYKAEGNVCELSEGIDLPGIPDGTYEFYEGKAYKIGSTGWAENLHPSHPICQLNHPLFITLFNYGIEFETLASHRNYPSLVPFSLRYIYYRDQALYVMGHKIFEKNDLTLQTFIEGEKHRQENSPFKYQAFIDKGPPLNKAGYLDKEFIQTFGLKIPEQGYLVLGDNHAMSADSRFFGFAPESNLKGMPIWIFWPPSQRWGSILQPQSPFLRFPNIVVSGTAIFICGFLYLVSRSRHRALMRQLD